MRGPYILYLENFRIYDVRDDKKETSSGNVIKQS